MYLRNNNSEQCISQLLSHLGLFQFDESLLGNIQNAWTINHPIVSLCWVSLTNSRTVVSHMTCSAPVGQSRSCDWTAASDWSVVCSYWLDDSSQLPVTFQRLPSKDASHWKNKSGFLIRKLFLIQRYPGSNLFQM